MLRFTLTVDDYLNICTNKRSIAVYKINTLDNTITSIHRVIGSEIFYESLQGLIDKPIEDLLPYCEVLKMIYPLHS